MVLVFRSTFQKPTHLRDKLVWNPGVHWWAEALQLFGRHRQANHGRPRSKTSQCARCKQRTGGSELYSLSCRTLSYDYDQNWLKYQNIHSISLLKPEQHWTLSLFFSPFCVSCSMLAVLPVTATRSNLLYWKTFNSHISHHILQP